MLILQIKQAETSLADGRLDEAYEIARDDRIRQHRRGQQLVTRLAGALARRGREHLEQQCPAQALADCNKAEKLAGNKPEIAELRKALVEAGINNRQKQQHQNIRIAKARDCIHKGWLSAGEHILQDDAGDDGAADVLLEMAATRRVENEAAFRRGQEALDRGDLEAAFEIVRQSGKSEHQNKDMADLTAHVKKLAAERIRQALEQGRIDQAKALLNRVLPLAGQTFEIAELERLTGKISRVCHYIRNGQPRQALHILAQLKNTLPSAGWINKAIGNMEQAANALEALRSGPLGLAMSSGFARQSPGESVVSHEPATVRTEDQNISGTLSTRDDNEFPIDAQIPGRFIIQIDGVGSFLVLRETLVTVGPISSEQRPGIGLVAEPDLPVVTIERIEEDYFLRAARPVCVNDKQVNEKLLNNNDNIALSDRCRLKFQLPNAASTTACIVFSGAKHPRLDVRQAIMMDREIIVGPGSTAHIRVDRGSDSIVLFLRNGQLHCRTKENVEVQGKPLPPHTGLPMEVPVKIGGVSLVLTKI